MPEDLALEQPLGLQLSLLVRVSLGEVRFLGLLDRADQVPQVAVLNCDARQHLVRRVLEVVPGLVEEEEICHRYRLRSPGDVISRERGHIDVWVRSRVSTGDRSERHGEASVALGWERR
jgi:hypothetical protein